MVQPGVTGFVVSVDPTHTPKAIRELTLLFDSFISDVENKAKRNGDIDCAERALPPLTWLLMDELNEARRAAKQHNKTQQRASVLETNCKGYVFINVPKARNSEAPEASLLGGAVANDGGEAIDGSEAVDEGKGEPSEPLDREVTVPSASLATAGGEVPTQAVLSTAEDTITGSQAVVGAGEDTITENRERKRPRVERDPLHSVNWRVAEIVDDLFDDALSNPRPLVRFSYRLYPVFASCNPTPEALQPIVVHLLEQIEVSADTGAKQPQISLGIQFLVRNNTQIEQLKSTYRALLESWVRSIQIRDPVTGTEAPKFRLISHSGVQMEAMLSVFVVHSTACVGVMTDYSTRFCYNIHDIGTTASGAAS